MSNSISLTCAEFPLWFEQRLAESNSGGLYPLLEDLHHLICLWNALVFIDKKMRLFVTIKIKVESFSTEEKYPHVAYNLAKVVGLPKIGN